MNKQDRIRFNRHIQRKLTEVRQEAEAARSLDREIDPVPDSAYSDVISLLGMLPDNLPIPDIGWLTDGGIGFEWRLGKNEGIGTMSIYGDNRVVYGASLGGEHRVKGTCPLLAPNRLLDFLKILSEAYRE